MTTPKYLIEFIDIPITSLSIRLQHIKYQYINTNNSEKESN